MAFTLIAQARSTAVTYTASSGDILMAVGGSQYNADTLTLNAFSTETEQIFYDTHGTFFVVRVAKVSGSGTITLVPGSPSSGEKYIAVYKLE